jgi:type II secretory pathway pseudopilin PulG
MAQDRAQDGYTLSEAVVVVAIVMLAALAIMPNLKQRIEQSRVDGVTTRLEGALNSLRSQSLTYQTNCTLSWSLPSSGQGLTAGADQIGTRLLVDASTCPLPVGTPRPRLSPPLRSPDDADVSVTISPERFTITAFGGLATTGDLPLLLRIRPNRPSQNGDFERCLRLEPITGAISRGTWVGGDCRRSS